MQTIPCFVYFLSVEGQQEQVELVELEVLLMPELSRLPLLDVRQTSAWSSEVKLCQLPWTLDCSNLAFVSTFLAHLFPLKRILLRPPGVDQRRLELVETRRHNRNLESENICRFRSRFWQDFSSFVQLSFLTLYIE